MSNNFMKSRKPSKSPKGAVRRSLRKALLANIIQGEVGFFNGWAVSKESERDSCEKAAEKILARIERWKRPTMKTKQPAEWIGYVRRQLETWKAALEGGRNREVATIERENMKRNLSEAVNLSCSCGGNPAGTEACPACMVWHRMSPNAQD